MPLSVCFLLSLHISELCPHIVIYLAIFTSDTEVEKVEDKNRWRYFDPEYHTKNMEIVIEMPSIQNAKPKDRIPFMITLEVDEIKGVTVSVQCEVGTRPKYQVQPKFVERSLGYFCESKLKGPRKARRDEFFPSSSIN